MILGGAGYLTFKGVQGFSKETVKTLSETKKKLGQHELHKNLFKINEQINKDNNNCELRLCRAMLHLSNYDFLRAINDLEVC